MAMNGLDKITEKILAEADAEALEIEARADAQAKAIAASYAERAEAIRKTVAANAEREGIDLVNRAKNADAVKHRNAILRVRGELVDETFDATLEALRTQGGEKYVALLAGLLAAAVLEQVEAEAVSRTLYGEEDAMAPEAYEVLFSAADRETYADAVLAATRAKLAGKIDQTRVSMLKVSDKTVQINGGLILRCGDIESNCSLDLLFAGLRRELESEVSHALFDTKERL